MKPLYKKQLIELMVDNLIQRSQPVNRVRIKIYLNNINPEALAIALRSGAHDRDLINSVVDGYVKQKENHK